jgi:hypothetical protein
MSAAVSAASASTCRLPTDTPQDRSIAAAAWAYEPRAASIAASRRSSTAWDNPPARGPVNQSTVSSKR